MKKFVSLILALVLMLTPISVHASQTVKPQSDELDRWDMVWSDRSESRTDEFGREIFAQDEYWLKEVVEFVPRISYAHRNSNSVTIIANVTTASLMTVVQVSTKKTFPKDKTMTYTFQNSKYQGMVTATRHWLDKETVDKNGGVHPYRSVERVLKQEGKSLTYRKLVVLNIYGTLNISQDVVDTAREKVRYDRKFIIPSIKQGTRYYIRMRNVYEGLNRSRNYSEYVMKVVR